MRDAEALVDEIALLLHARDVIESDTAQLRVEDPESLRLVDELDRLLLLSREQLLARVPDFSSFRRHRDIPRQHWWYFLDLITRVQVEEFALPAADREDETIVLPEQVTIRKYAL
jgi:hypothetical protein